MRGVILVTDHDWFEFLSQQTGLDEVNFWRPSDTRTPRQFVPGMPVLFKLRKRYGGWIVGWGRFAKFEMIPAWLAWECFERKNGAATFPDMLARIGRLRPGTSDRRLGTGDFEIGCIMLAEPVFLPSGAWVKAPADWPENAVQGSAYDLSIGEGSRVWRECLARGAGHGIAADRDIPSTTAEARYGEPVLIRPRLGQGIFRLAVTDAYGRACAVTSEHSLPALEAAHIRPFGEGGAHEIANGLLLRSDIHRLFDRGYVGVTPDLHFVVSPRLKDDFSNGRSYYPLHGQAIRLPQRGEDRPDASWLEWHQRERFRA